MQILWYTYSNVIAIKFEKKVSYEEASFLQMCSTLLKLKLGSCFLLIPAAN